MSKILVKYNEKREIMKKIKEEIKDFVISKFLSVIISQSKEIKYLKDNLEEYKKQAINALKKLMNNEDKNTLYSENDNKSQSRIENESSITSTNYKSPSKKRNIILKKLSSSKKNIIQNNKKAVTLKVELNYNKAPKICDNIYGKTEDEEKNVEFNKNNVIIKNKKNSFFYSPKFNNLLSEHYKNKASINSTINNKNNNKKETSNQKNKTIKENSKNKSENKKTNNSRNMNLDLKNSISYLTQSTFNNNDNLTNINLYNSTYDRYSQTITYNNRLSNSVGKNFEIRENNIQRLTLNQKRLKTISYDSFNSLNLSSNINFKNNTRIRIHSLDVRNNNKNVKEYKNFLYPNLNQKIIKVISNNSNKGINLDPEFMNKMNYYMNVTNK